MNEPILRKTGKILQAIGRHLKEENDCHCQLKYIIREAYEE